MNSFKHMHSYKRMHTHIHACTHAYKYALAHAHVHTHARTQNAYLQYVFLWLLAASLIRSWLLSCSLLPGTHLWDKISKYFLCNVPPHPLRPPPRKEERCPTPENTSGGNVYHRCEGGKRSLSLPTTRLRRVKGWKGKSPVSILTTSSQRCAQVWNRSLSLFTTVSEMWKD